MPRFGQWRPSPMAQNSQRHIEIDLAHDTLAEQGGAVALNHFTGKLVAWDAAEIVIAALQLKVCVAIPATSIRISAKPGGRAGTAVSRTKTCPGVQVYGNHSARLLRDGEK